MNKQKPVSAARVALWLWLFLAVCLFRPLAVSADETDLYHESLKFDSNGNLLMTTRDKKAGSNVRYKTIGWTLKRTQASSDHTSSVRLRLEQNGASVPDPSDPDYVFTYFKCDKALIFAKIGEASEDWQKDLYQNGGTVYLDAIMTIVENGRTLGSMDANGILRGEVYTTAYGIMNARDWADVQGLRTHFNKALYFPPLPDMLVPEEAQEDQVKIVYGTKERANCNEVYVQAASKDEPKFDVEKGIPTGEEALVTGQLQKYYYRVIFTHYYGTAAVPVTINVTYTYTEETEEGPVSRSFTSRSTYYASRPYSYYRIKELHLYALEQVITENEALPVVPLESERLYQMELTLERNREKYLEIPSFSTSVYGGDLTEGNCISGQELQQIADSVAGDVAVRNDVLGIDGETILDGSTVKASAPQPMEQSGARLRPYQSADMIIPHTKKNDVYDTYAVAVYRNVLEQNVREHVVKHVNEVVVHTPVVCKGGISDDIAHNQQIVPTKYMSLVLGRSFLVGISTVGTHKDQKGYKTRDYATYTALRQIRFPFEVYADNVRYDENTWIDLPSESQTFYLPVGVHEGDYRIRYRTIAKNAAAKRGGIDKNGYLANMDLSEYGAYDELTVTVVGRMYDLAVTDIVDYPRWRSVFYRADGSNSRYAFWVGRNNLEGDLFSARLSQGILPVLQGDHPYNRSAHAAGLGYRVKIQLKTIGDMRGAEAQIALLPTYYYISRDGSRRQRVHLYRKKDLSEVYQILLLTARNRSFLPVETRNVSDPQICAQSVQVWDGEYQLSPDLYLVDADVDLDSYIRQHGGRIRQQDPVFLRDGYLLVQFEVRSYAADSDQTGHLSYANTGNSMRGYCNMWRLQGFSYERMDGLGNRFLFADGDCLLFDTKYTLHSDYESWGTH